MNNQELGREIKRARQEAGLTQARVAAFMTEAGFRLHQTQITSIESGDRPLTIMEAIAICSIVGVDLAAIVRVGADEETSGHDLRFARVQLAMAERELQQARDAQAEARTRVAAARATVGEQARQVRELEAKARESARADAVARAEQAVRALSDARR